MGCECCCQGVESRGGMRHIADNAVLVVDRVRLRFSSPQVNELPSRVPSRELEEMRGDTTEIAQVSREREMSSKIVGWY